MTGQDLAHRPTIGAAVNRHTLPRQASTQVATVQARLVPTGTRTRACTCGRDCTGEDGYRDCLDAQIYNRLRWAAQCDHFARVDAARLEHARATGCHPSDYEQNLTANLALGVWLREQAELARRMRDGEL